MDITTTGAMAAGTNYGKLGFSKEAAVYAGIPNYAFGDTGSVIMGNSTVTGGIGRAYYQPDLTSIAGVRGEEIVSAAMYFYDLQGKQDPDLYSLYQVTEEWSAEDITYANQPAVAPTATVNYYNNDPYIDFQMVTVTGLVREWKKQNNNYGFMVRKTDESKTGRCVYTTSSYTDVSKRPYLAVTYRQTQSDYWGFMNTVQARGEVIEGTNVEVNFTVSQGARFHMETAQPNAPYGIRRDTKLYLYNESSELIGFSDDISQNNGYSRIFMYLQPGNYRVWITEKNGSFDKIENIHTFFAIWEEGKLDTNDLSFYANKCKNFIRLETGAGKYYRCFGYVLGVSPDNCFEGSITVSWTLSNITAILEQYGYTRVNSATDNCIVVYGCQGTEVQHFAKIENRRVTAKLSSGDIVSHTGYDVYYDNSGYFEGEEITAYCGYGVPLAYFVKE